MSAQPCVNHPRELTRVACSSCGDPICPRCMRQSAVGQKCPACARTPRGARALGRPSHYVKGVGAGLGAGVLGGLLLGQVLVSVRFGVLIVSAAVGFGVGKAVAWGAARQAHQPFPAIAAGSAVAGIAVGLTLLLGSPLPTASPWLLIGYAAAGYFAVRGLHS